MITRRSLFLGSAAIITTPGLLMPVRRLIAPVFGLRQIVDDIDRMMSSSMRLAANPPLIIGVDWSDPVKGDHTVITRAGLVNGYIGAFDSFVLK